MPAKDYYATLGVPRNASEEDIKRAYRNLARRYHPDVSPDHDKPRAESHFKDINEAYAVLSDARKRAHYDRFGSMEGQMGPNTGAPGEGFSDIFDFFFGGGMGRQAGPGRGSDLRYDIQVGLEEILSGAEREIGYDRLAVCETCSGKGSADGRDAASCPDCGGSGELRHARNTPFGQFISTAPCVRCGGTGRVVKNPCKACQGRGRRDRREQVKVKVPAGAEDGTRIRYTGLGEAGDRGGPSGDLYVYINVAPHEIFQRNGSDVSCETAVSFTQAALGATLEIEALDGSATLKLPAGTQTGTTFRIGGRGLPKMRGHGRGDLIVEVRVSVPKRLTRKQRQLLEEFARAGGDEGEDKPFLSKVREAFVNE